MLRIVLAILWAFPILFASQSASAQDAQYEITNLIKAHDIENELVGAGAWSIHDNGTIVGFTAQSAIKASPFYTVDGKPIRVKTGEFGATFIDVNADGIIVGRDVTGRNEDGSPIGFPAIWVDGVMSRLELPVDALGQSPITGAARSINDAGLIVGEITFPGEEYNQSVVVWTNGVPTVLPDVFGYPACAGWGLSESGRIGGDCWEPTIGAYRPVVWQDFSPIVLDGPPQGGTEMLSLVDTSDGGYASVGRSYDNVDPALQTEITAVLFIDGNAQALPAPVSLPFCAPYSVAETDAGLLVGGECAPDLAVVHSGYSGRQAVAWLDGQLIELNNAIPAEGGWTLILIRGVNSEGQMVGLGERNGERRSFLLTPAN